MQMKRQNSRAKVIAERCGFTLVEMLLVVVIITLLAGVGGGICVGTYRRMLVKKSARDFVLAAIHARMTAIEQQSPCRIELDTDRNGFALVGYGFNEQTSQTESAAGGPLTDSYFKKPVEFAGGVEFEHIQITPTGTPEATEVDEDRTIVFLPNGTAQLAVVQIGDGKSHYTVGICAATGRAKMQFGTAEEIEIGTVDLDEQ